MKSQLIEKALNILNESKPPRSIEAAGDIRKYFSQDYDIVMDVLFGKKKNKAEVTGNDGVKYEVTHKSGSPSRSSSVQIKKFNAGLKKAPKGTSVDSDGNIEIDHEFENQRWFDDLDKKYNKAGYDSIRLQKPISVKRNINISNIGGKIEWYTKPYLVSKYDKKKGLALVTTKIGSKQKEWLIVKSHKGDGRYEINSPEAKKYNDFIN